MFVNMLRIACGDRIISTDKQPRVPVVEIKGPSAPEMGMGKYEPDIKALVEKYGNLESRTITIQLQDMLDIAPRDRRRIEAYQGLISTLQKIYNRKLTLVSRKNK